MPQTTKWKRLILTISLIVGLTSLNYVTYYGLAYEHAFYRILLYIPLILGSFWFGIKGAIAIAIGMILLFSPYTVANWHGFSLEDFHVILEAILYFGIALILGGLIEKERKRQTALVEAESLAAVGRTVLELAHDMKTPLMSIGGFATQVSRAIDSDDSNRKKLELVIQETGRLENMVKEMLVFGKPVKLQLANTNLSDLAREVIDELIPLAGKAQVTLKTELDPLLLPLMLDRAKIKQALFNLIMNALEASPSGEHVTVKTDGNRQIVNLYVMDRGGGIDPEDVDKVFEPFFTKKRKGTGLGLPIVKKIVETHRGQIFYHTNKEKGATFIVTFPMSYN